MCTRHLCRLAFTGALGQGSRLDSGPPFLGPWLLKLTFNPQFLWPLSVPSDTSGRKSFLSQLPRLCGVAVGARPRPEAQSSARVPGSVSSRVSASSLQVSPGPGRLAGQPGMGAAFTLRFSFWAHVSFSAFKHSPPPSSSPAALRSVTCCLQLAGLCSLPPQLGFGSSPRRGSQKTAALSRHSSLLSRGNS